jgi:DNA-binding response OmpR family regulator
VISSAAEGAMYMKACVAIVTADDPVLELIRQELGDDSFTLHVFRDGETLLAFAESTIPDLLILDLSSPETDGHSVCRFMRGKQRTSSLPIIMLNSETTAADRIIGLDLGADDYVSKPFDPGELTARIRALLRRARAHAPPDIINRGDLRIDANSYEAMYRGERLDLTISEYRILYTLCKQPGWVFTRAQLLEQLGQQDKRITERTVDVHIRHIREKLGRGGWLIETVRGVGYKFERRQRQRVA